MDKGQSIKYIEKRLELIRLHCKKVSESIKSKEDSVIFKLVQEYYHELALFHESIVDEDFKEVSIIQLGRDFSLSPFEIDCLLLCLGVSLDSGIKLLMSDLKQSYTVTGVEIGIALMLFSRDFESRVSNRAYFSSVGVFVSERLIEISAKMGKEGDILEAGLSLSSRIQEYLLCQENDLLQLNGFSRLIWPEADIEDVIMPRVSKEQVLSLVTQYDRYVALKSRWSSTNIGDSGRSMVLLFSGASGTGKTLLSHAIAKLLNRPLLLVDVQELKNHRSLESNLDILMREARLQRAVLLFDDCEFVFSNRLQGNTDLSLILNAIDRYEGLIILTTNLGILLDSALERRVVLHIDFEIGSRKQREEIWRIHIPKELPLSEDVDLSLLAEKYEFSGGTIRNTVVVAINRALSEYSALDEFCVSMRHFEEAAKTQVRNKIKKLANKTMSNLSLGDLILPRKIKEKIIAIIASVRNRRIIFEEWGFGEKLTTGKGLCILFRGDSGTGKTLCAEILSNELGMTLYRVRIPAIMSKYVGETEKNLEKCFRDAAASGALLLFDEADSIFSKRTEVQSANDRYSNMEVNLLLQEIERFDGVVILTTNLDAAIDDAFERRLNHKIDFPFPDERDRARIWRHLIPEAAPMSADVDFETLGREFELSGGCIKNAVIRGAYMAAEHGVPLSMEILEQSGIQEYREMGKLVNSRRRNPWD